MHPRTSALSAIATLLIAALLVGLAMVSAPRSAAPVRPDVASNPTPTAQVHQAKEAPAPLLREAIASDASESEVEVAENRGLRIVDERCLPVPGAEYFVGSGPYWSMDGLLVCEAEREQWHPNAWLTSHCTRKVADASGRLTEDAADPQWAPWCCARHEDRLACWDNPFPHDLVLQPERRCKVTVVDAVGATVAGAMVVLRGNDEVIVGITDARGACEVAHLQRLTADRETQNASFGIRGLGLRSADVTFAAAAPPAEVTLTLPACGPIAVELLDVDGARIASSEPILLRADDGEAIAEYSRPSGPIEFGLCACDLQLTVTNKNGHRIAGPHVAGERVTATLRCSDLQPGGYVLSGFALGADGAALPGCVLHARTTPGSELDGRPATTTTPAGRFSFVFAADSREELLDDRGISIVLCAERKDGSLVDVRGAIVHVTGPLRAGIVDLGNVVLLDAAILARGRVRAAGGEHVDATVWSNWQYSTTDVALDRAGAFTVRGLRDLRRVALEVEADGYLPTSVRTELPCPDIDIVLQPRCKLAVHVEVDPELFSQSESLNIELVGADGTRVQSRTFGEESAWYCPFAAAPGEYRCEVRTILRTEPLASVPCVVTRGANDGEPLRIDLRGRLGAMHLRFVDAAGERIDPSDLFVRPSGPPHASEGRIVWDAINGWEDDRVLIGTCEPVSLAFEGPRYAGAWSGPFGDATITLQRVPEIPFHVVDLPGVAAGDRWQLEASANDGEGAVRFSTGHARPNTEVDSEVAADGSGTLRLLPRTRYAITLRFRPGKDSPRGRRTLAAIPAEIEIGEALPEKLEFRFDAQQMQDAVR